MHCFNQILLIITLLFSPYIFSQKKKDYKIHTVAFYNLENLFDTENDPNTYDDDRTPEGRDHWTLEIYQDKLKNMAKVIADIGAKTTKNTPVIVGVAEIENQKVLEDLVNQPSLVSKDYGIIQFDSPDRRGIDVALLYQKKLFRPSHQSPHTLYIYDQKDKSKRIYTRDQLLVSGYLDGDLIHIIVNHWPSRRGGEARSSYKREKAAALNKKIIDSLHQINPYAKIITMGDLNDDPSNSSVKKVLGCVSDKEDAKTKGLYNPMFQMAKKGMGSLAWDDRWNLFDQIIVSKGLIDKNYSSYQYYKAGIFNPKYLVESKGKYKGYPYRSYTRGQYIGGYSDHFPVYIFLIKDVEF